MANPPTAPAPGSKRPAAAHCAPTACSARARRTVAKAPSGLFSLACAPLAFSLVLALPALLALGATLQGCSPQPQAVLHKFAGPTMGSTYHISYVQPADGPARPPQQVQPGVQAILTEIDEAVSTYRTDSALARFNAAPAPVCMDMPAAALALGTYAQRLWADSEGAYDVTLLPLLQAWGFAHQPQPAAALQAPDDAALQALRQRMGMTRWRVQGHQWCKDAPVQIEFNSIAAGYAVDRIAQYLSSLGLDNHLVEVTGEMRAAGRKPDGSAWRVAIEAPLDNARQAQRIVRLDGWALSTSGDYRNWREINGQRHSHTLDPRTLAPVRHALASVTVAARTALQADGLSTLLMVLGPQEGMDHARRHGIAALFITRQGQGFASAATPAFTTAFATGETTP